MTLKNKLQEDLKTAMKAGNKPKVTALRLTLANIKIAETAEGRTERGDLPDDQVAALLQTEIKRRRDTITELEKVDRPALLADEKAELAAMLEYVPQQLSRDEIAGAARAIIAEMGATSPAQMGEVMKRLLAQHKGQVDGKVASQIVRDLLAGQ